MSINPEDLDKIDQQIKIQKGSLPMKFEKDDGDENPPNIDQSIAGLKSGEVGENGEGGAINVAVALKGFWKFIDMMLSMLISRIDALDYKNLSDAELTNISQQTAQVEVFQKLAVAENAPMWLSVANLVGTFGTKFSLSPEWKAKQAAKKLAEKRKEEALARRELTPEQKEIIERLKKPVNEPVYDNAPKDVSEPVQVVDKPFTDEEVLDAQEMRLKDQLLAASELTDLDIQKMKVMKRAAAIKREQAEKQAKERAKNSGVGYLEE